MNEVSEQSTNLNMLMFYNKPRSIQEVKDLLDKRGYAGRNTPRMVRKQGMETDLMKVSIYLPESDYTYEWPHENYYNIRKGKLDKKVSMKYIPNLLYYMQVFISFPHLFKAGRSTEWVASAFETITRHDCIRTQAAADQLVKLGLVRDGLLILKTMDDIHEVLDNNFTVRLINYLV